MTNREIFKNYVKNGGSFICSPQIGAGAGFDTRLAGKTWTTSTTMEDTIAACRMFDIIPLFNMGMCDLTTLVDDYSVSSTMEVSKGGKRKTYRNTFHTPYGELYSTLIDEEFMGACPTEFYIKDDEEQLDILEYYLDSLLEVKDFSCEEY